MSAIPKRIITLIFILAIPAWLCADNDALSQVWSAPNSTMKERAEAVNQAFTNGTPISVIVEKLGTNYIQCFSSFSLSIGPGPEQPNTPWLSYRFGEEQVTIHTTASISEGPLKGNFTGAGYSIPVGTPKRTTDHIWIGKANGNLPEWVTNSVRMTNGIWIGPKDGAAPFHSVTNQTYTNAMSELSLKPPPVRTARAEHSCTVGMSRKEVRAQLADSWLYVSASRPSAGWSRQVSPPAGALAARFEISHPGAVESCDVYWIGHNDAPKKYYGKRLDYFYFDSDEKLIGFTWCIID